MPRKQITLSRYTRNALELLGGQIELARKRRGWSASALAERAGIDRSTVSKIESGSPGVAIGTFFEVASLVGLPLFSDDLDVISREVARSKEMLALLPKTIQPKRRVDDDF
jgi:transcriptional regulator with XRE-family HTH domain